MVGLVVLQDPHVVLDVVIQGDQKLEVTRKGVGVSS